MSAEKIIVEIDSWCDADPATLMADLSDTGVIGVLVKVSQGTKWVSGHAPAFCREAVKAGLLVGALHYLEPTKNDPIAERSFALNNLPPAHFALGVVFEIDAMPVVDAYQYGISLEALLVDTETAGFETGLRCTGATLAQISGAPWRAKWWAAGLLESTTAVPFAVEDERPVAVPGGDRLTAYGVTNIRGLNFGASETAPAAASGPQSVPVDPTTPEAREDRAWAGTDAGIAARHAAPETPVGDPDDDEPDPAEVDTDQVPADWRAGLLADLDRAE